MVRDDHDYILAREIEEERVALKEARLQEYLQERENDRARPPIRYSPETKRVKAKTEKLVVRDERIKEYMLEK